MADFWKSFIDKMEKRLFQYMEPGKVLNFNRSWVLGVKPKDFLFMLVSLHDGSLYRTVFRFPHRVGNLTTFYLLDSNWRGNVTLFYPPEGHNRRNLTVFCSLVGHLRGQFILSDLLRGNTRGHSATFCHVEVHLREHCALKTVLYQVMSTRKAPEKAHC